MRRVTLTLFLLLLALSLTACVTRGGRGGGGGGGGTAPTTDDDADVVSDDDDGGEACVEQFFHNENGEPNDDQKQAEVITDGPNNYESYQISGQTSDCGGGEGYGDTDIFGVYVSCPGTVDLEVTWGGSSDLDLFLLDGKGTELISGVEEGFNGNDGEEGLVTVTDEAMYWVVVGCWDGDPTDYQISLEF